MKIFMKKRNKMLKIGKKLNSVKFFLFPGKSPALKTAVPGTAGAVQVT
jgi:hypothetical protein